MSSPSKLIGWLTTKIRAKVSEAFSDSPPRDDEAIDETIPVTERVMRYSESQSVSHRMYVVREVADLAREAGPQASVDVLVPVVEKLVRDPEASVRGQLVESVPAFCRFLMGNLDADGYTTNVLHILLPLVAELTTDDNPQTRAAAVTALVVLARTIRHEDLVPYLVPIIRSLAKDRTEEEHRVQAAILLHALAGTFGKDICLEHVVPRVEQLAQDLQFRVRKAVAQHLGMVVGVVCTKQAVVAGDGVGDEEGHAVVIVVKDEDRDAAEKEAKAAKALLDVFVGLSRDEIWGVRKACCDSLVAISKSYPSDVRSSLLVPLFEQLADDESRWVRGAAFQSLGPFIATFSDGRVDPKLLMFYRTMPHPQKHGRDGDITLYCAHAFPGVLLTVGGQRWAELSDLYLLLVKDLQWKVRETLAHSLHEVAKLVGQQVAERTLLTIFEAFMQDLEEVKIGVVMHLGDFLAVLGEECRSQYAHVVKELQEETNWRLREHTARQMAQFGALFAGKELSEVVLPACFALCRDSVLTVRGAAVAGMGKLLVALEELGHTELFEQARQNVWALQEGPFHDRQVMVQICSVYLEEKGKLRAMFVEQVESLAGDRVPNVRMKVATALRMQAPESPHLEVLRRDGDHDVRFGATGEFVPYPQRKNVFQGQSEEGQGDANGDEPSPPTEPVKSLRNSGLIPPVTPERAMLGEGKGEFVDSANFLPQLSESPSKEGKGAEMLATNHQ